MTRPILMISALFVIATGALAAAAQDARPQFEAASIKINKSGDTQTQLGGAGGRINITNMQLRGLIQSAYRVRAQQLVVPKWVEGTRVDVVAKADPKYSIQELQNMLAPLLEERLKLKYHREPREMDVLVLSLANKDGTLGPNLKRSAANCAADAAAPRNTLAPASSAAPRCGIIPSGPGRIVMHGIQMDALTAILGIGRQQVIDETGLTGPYDVDLTYTPDALSAAALAQRGGTVPPQFAGVDPNGPSLFQALKDQLGLKLEGRKMTLDVMVVDEIDQPDEN
jgi:uncharacterized protein (TIGR03435 family)